MLAVSDEVNQAWFQPSRKLTVRVTIDGEVYDSETVTSLSFDSESIAGEQFMIGSTPSSQIQMIFPSIIESIKKDMEVYPEIGILIEKEKEEESYYAYSKLGEFIITEFDRDRNGNKTTVTAVDQMIFMEGNYESKLTYPIAIQEVALEIANLSGVEIDQSSFQFLSRSTINEPKGYTYRQAIGLIAQFEGGYASFNREGKLQIKSLTPTDFVITPDNYLLKGLTKNENMYQVNGIKVRVGDDGEEENILIVGSTAGNVIELENKVMTQFLLDSIWSRVQKIKYYPFELKWRGNPNLEAGDWIQITDNKDNFYTVPNLSYSLEFNGGLSGSSKANTNSYSETTTKYKGPLQQVIEKMEGSVLGANGYNHNWYTSEAPSNPRVGDLWYDEVPDGGVILKKWTGTEWEIKKASTNLLTGTLDAENGDVDLINVNVYSLSGKISNFIQSYWNSINSQASINGDAFKYTHSDGSYTQMEAGGLTRYVAGTKKTYHYLTHLAGYVLNSTTAVRWAQLPDEFKGKSFTVYIAVADSLQAQNSGQSINRIVCTGHPNYSNDYKNARVPLIGYKLLTDGNKITVGDVQGLLIAIA